MKGSISWRQHQPALEMAGNERRASGINNISVKNEIISKRSINMKSWHRRSNQRRRK
jgi:hypothetical protein